MKRLPALLHAALIFLIIGNLTLGRAADAAGLGGATDGKKLQFTPQFQKRLIKESVKLLASCGNTVIQPKGTLENAKRRSHLHFTFPEPRSFDLGVEKKTETTDVQVKEMVITLPLSSGGAWIDSTKFRWYCSDYDAKVTQEIGDNLEVSPEALTSEPNRFTLLTARKRLFHDGHSSRSRCT